MDFGLETTLSGRSYVGMIRKLKWQGYKVNTYFLWVPTDEVTLSRVRDRVLKGGHDVPEVDVRRRFGRSIENFFRHYCPLPDSWILFDNSNVPPSEVALANEGGLRIIDQEMYNILVQTYGKR